MTSEFKERDKLHARLREVLGTDQAATLMGLLPDQDQIATKQDILQLKSDIVHLDSRIDRLDDRLGRLESSLQGFDERIWGIHGTLRSQTRVFITATVSSMTSVGALSFAATALV